MELKDKDYTGRRLGTTRKWLRYAVSLPFGILFFLTLLPAVVLFTGAVLAGVLGLLAILFAGIVVALAIAAVPGTVFLLTIAFSPKEFEEDESE